MRETGRERRRWMGKRTGPERETRERERERQGELARDSISKVTLQAMSQSSEDSV